MTKDKKKPKHNIWKDKSRYGTYEGEPGSPEQWASQYANAWDAATCKAMIKEKTPYEVLGIATGSDWPTIRHAYLTLIKKHHPDKFNGDVEKMAAETEICKEIIAAYTLLEDMRPA